MKKILVFLSAVLVLTSCSTGTSEYAKNGNDTIQTESGLRYIYTKKGTGQKVEEGSYVKSVLSLTVEDSVIWNTYNLPDSVYTFIVGYDRVIDGFEEMARLMREGDNVYVSIPDSLAYGSQGAGGLIPPYATIVYNIYDLVHVSEPKEIITDTLRAAHDAGGAQQALAVFESITQSEQKNNYHLHLKLIQPILNRMINAQEFTELNEVLNQLNYDDWEMDEITYGFYEIVVTEGLGDIDGAIEITKRMIEKDPGQAMFRTKLKDLESKK